NGILNFVAADSGKILSKVRLPVKDDDTKFLTMKLQDGKVFIMLNPSKNITKLQVTSEGGNTPETSSKINHLWCYDLTKENLEWHIEVDGAIRTWWASEGHIGALTFSGDLLIISTSLHKVISRFAIGDLAVNFDVHLMTGNRYVVANEAHL